MKTIQNLQKVSLLFFLIFGAVHIGSSLMIANKYFVDEATLINRTFDIPVILSGICYGFSNLKLNLNQNKIFQRILNVILIIAGFLMVLLLTYLNFYLLDR